LTLVDYAANAQTDPLPAPPGLLHWWAHSGHTHPIQPLLSWLISRRTGFSNRCESRQL
jgi:hypothetical protein